MTLLPNPGFMGWVYPGEKYCANPDESMGLGRDQTQNPWIGSQTRNNFLIAPTGRGLFQVSDKQIFIIPTHPCR